jgi:hypothetical protein
VNLTLAKHRTIFFVVLFGLAEIIASMCVWRGAPLDANTDMGLSFWRFEAWRLEYWLCCFTVAASLWLFFWWSLKRHESRRQDKVICLRKILLTVAAGGLAIGSEGLTSVWYWRQMPWGQSGYTGTPYSPFYPYFLDYFWGHLTVWALILGIGLIGRYVRHKQSLTQAFQM